MRAYLDNITETRRFLERHENRLYSLLVDSRANGVEDGNVPNPRPPLVSTPLPASPPPPQRRVISPPLSQIDPIQVIMENLIRGIGIDISGGNATNPIQPSWWDPIAVVPTEEDIERGVDTVQYMDISGSTDTMCPITQTEFQDMDEVSQITACGHIFSSNGLREWFTRSVQCPVCRHDVRDVLDGRDTIGDSPDSATEFLTRTFGMISSVDIGTLDVSSAFVSGYGGYMSDIDPSDMSFSVEITDGSGNVYRHRDFNMR